MVIIILVINWLKKLQPLSRRYFFCPEIICSYTQVYLRLDFFTKANLFRGTSWFHALYWISTFLNIVVVPFFSSKFGFCSPEVPSFPDPPKPWEDLIYNEIKCVYACAFITGKDHISRYLVTSIQISALSIALMLLNKFFSWLEYDKINLIELQWFTEMLLFFFIRLPEKLFCPSFLFYENMYDSWWDF